jgi:5'-methylthioadenosine phosphorylase
MTRIGVIGGSGLYDMEGFTAREEIALETPYGAPSDAVVVGRLEREAGNAVEVAFLPRHGRGHRLLPSEINFRANIWALKKLGCEQVISVSAVGSMKEEIPPGTLVFPDQFIDRTTRRPSTFFGEGVVAHVGFSDPVCPRLRSMLAAAAREERIPHQDRGTYICIEGPQFSTRAESFSYRALGVDVIGMTNMPEAKLAREAEVCYATVALATDYDCWKEHEEAVSAEAVVKTLRENVARAKRVIARALPALAGARRTCGCGDALASAIMSDRANLPEAARKKLGLLIEKYAK